MRSVWSGSLLGRYSDDLPHWVAECGVYAVTIRCRGSLPATVISAMAERWTSLRAIPAQSPEAEAARRHLFRELEAALDAGAGFAPFRTTRLARMFSACLEEYDRDGLRFPGFVVMPNHVHLVTDSVEFGSVEAFQRAWRRFKGASGRWLNAELGRTGPFWQYAWYDRWVRTPEEWRKWMRYLEQNPVRAGLCECPKDYPFARIAQEPPR